MLGELLSHTTPTAFDLILPLIILLIIFAWIGKKVYRRIKEHL